MMRTGDGEMDTSQIESAAMDLFLPVMESATVLAAHYAKACGRNCVMAEDMSYGLMYAARNVTGRQIGSLYPEIYQDSDTESDHEDEESGTDSDEEDSWTQYEGVADDTAAKMNECAATWSSWVPTNPAERALKNAVDKNSFFGRGE
jgi:hypothetical protein